MTASYATIIEGKSRDIIGMDADGKYLLNSDEKLWIKPFKKGEIARSRTLKKVSKLTFTDGEWLLDGKSLKAQIITARMERHNSGEIHTVMRTLDWLYEVLPEKGNPKINGVAWFQEGSKRFEGETAEDCAVRQDFLDSFHGADKFVVKPPLPPAKEFRPVLLSDFCITSHQHLPKLPRKPVARFENNYTVALIPRKDGKETAMTIEPELLGFLRKIFASGGIVPRTKLRNEISDNYQPEKLLMSKVAKALIKAKLVGSNKSGRTTVYWAKEFAT
ncbi:MAG: hypothetical protein WCS42_12545 [Verrucomicrobiota bacterium]